MFRENVDCTLKPGTGTTQKRPHDKEHTTHSEEREKKNAFTTLRSRSEEETQKKKLKKNGVVSVLEILPKLFFLRENV
jgi:hypothetical protein